jgi:hypothetical protein
MPRKDIAKDGVNTQWKEGQSGNQDGRPKDFLTQILKGKLHQSGHIIIEGELIDDNNKPTGKKVRVKVAAMNDEKLIIALLNQAVIKGNVRAIEMIYERMEGKILNKVELSENKENPVTIFKLPDNGR